MEFIRVDLPATLLDMELHIFADEHIGNPQSDLDRVKARIDIVKNTPNAYAVLDGDILDNTTKASLGDIYTQVFNPMEQVRLGTELFQPIKDKILCITRGNHEDRTYRTDGIDLSGLIAHDLGLHDRYSPTAAVLCLTLGSDEEATRKGTPVAYTMYILHGAGGGRKMGAKAIRLEEMASIIDCDVYIHAHTHQPISFRKGFYRVSSKRKQLTYVERLFVNVASNLTYGGYAETKEFPPGSLKSPIIYLSGKRRHFAANV